MKHQCPECGFVRDMPEFKETKPLIVTFEGMADKPCWRIKWGTLDSFWWGPESAFEACCMMYRHWRDWTPSYQIKRMFWSQVRCEIKDSAKTIK